MLNILFISDLYPQDPKDSVTDVSFALHYFVREWVKRTDVYVQVVVPNAVGLKKMLTPVPSHQEFILDDVKVMSCVIRCKALIGRWFFSTRHIRSYLESNSFKPDIIVSHMPIGNEIGLRLRDYYGVACICGVHMSDLNALDSGISSINHAENISWRSPSVRSRGLERIGPKNEFIALSGIPEGLIIDHPRSLNGKRILRFITVGRLLPLKKVDLVMEVLSRLPEGYRWHYTIVGDGEEMESLIDKAKQLGILEKVKFTGELSREKCISLMDDHDVFVMPSHPETLGLVYLEAMARGLLVIGAKHNGVDGVIEDGVDGFLAEPDSVQDLIRIITGIYEQDNDSLLVNSLITIQDYIDSRRAKDYLDFILSCAR